MNDLDFYRGLIDKAEARGRCIGLQMAYDALKDRLSQEDRQLLLDMAIRELCGTAAKQEKAA